MDVGSSCFCHSSSCPNPSPIPSSSQSQSREVPQAMDLDSALSELGMLSSVCDGKQQYLLERRKKEMLKNIRERKFSEPTSFGEATKPRISVDSSDKSHCGAYSTPTNSPSKGVPAYQVVQLNPAFVTQFTSGTAAHSPTIPTLDFKNSNLLDKGNKFNQENMEVDSHSKRLSRIRFSKAKRFKKPYEMPWLQRHSIDSCHPYSLGNPVTHEYICDYPSLSMTDLSGSFQPSSLSNPITDNQGTYGQPLMSELISSDDFSSSFSNECDKQPQASRSERNILANSTATVDKLRCHGDGNGNHATTSSNGSHKVPGQFSRSKSLDELDFANLKVAEYETKTLIQERKEIDNMSNYLQNLNVSE